MEQPNQDFIESSANSAVVSFIDSASSDGVGLKLFLNNALSNDWLDQIYEITGSSLPPMLEDVATKAEVSTSLADETRNNVRRFMRDFSPNLINAKNQSGVLIIGLVKVGKSTLVNALDPETKFYYEGSDDEPKLVAKNSRRLARMGDNNTRSETAYPTCYPTIEDSYLIVDFPGMLDPSHIKRPAQAFSMFLTKETLREIKGVVVMMDQANLSATYFDFFIEILGDLRKIFSSKGDFSKLTFVISTKNLDSFSATPGIISRKIKNIQEVSISMQK